MSKSTLVLAISITSLILPTLVNTKQPYCVPTEHCWPDTSDIHKFSSSLDGRIVQPEDPGYDKLSWMKVLYFNKNPAIIVLVESPNDVIKSVEFATRFDIRITIHSCGHDLNGRSTADGCLQINFVNMTDVTLNLSDPNSPTGFSVTAQAGAEWGRVYKEVSKHKKLVVGGFCPKVCVAGFTMGGGFGPLSPSYGLATDDVISFKIVLHNGVIATCTQHETAYKTTHKDGSFETTRVNDTSLFWAVRGGGGGSFGVVLLFKFQIHESPSYLVGLQIKYPIYEGDNNSIGVDVMRFLIDFLPTLPKEWGGITVNGYLSPLESLGNPTVNILLLHNGPWDSASMKSIDGLLNFRPNTQSMVKFTNYSKYDDYVEDTDRYPKYLTFLHYNGFIHTDKLVACEKRSSGCNGGNSGATKDGLAGFLAGDGVVSSISGTVTGCAVIILGKKVRNGHHPPSAISPAFRRADLEVSCFEIAPLPLLVSMEEMRHDVDRLDGKLRVFTQGMYLNEPAIGANDWANRFWGENLANLTEIKQQFDPHNVFTCHHCIGSHGI